MSPLAVAFLLLFACTVVITATSRAFAGRRPKAPHDRSSMWLGVAHASSLLAAAIFPWVGLGNLPVGTLFAWAGIALLGAGFVLQLLAIITLRGSYTLSLQAQAGQEIVARGPYRWVRHPGYLAQMIFWLGFALATRNLIVIAVVVLADLASYLNRIRVEERLLLRTLGDPYRRYAQGTKRLLPGVW